MMISTQYEFGDIVFLKTDIDQLERLITEITISEGNTLVFTLSCGTLNTKHFEFEFSKEVILKDD